MTAVDSLMARMGTADTLVCCGLDPDVRRLPAEIMNDCATDAERVQRFLGEVISLAGPHVCAFKAQKAFFDAMDGGHEVLRNAVSQIHRDHPDVPVFVDCKVGDIDNTMDAYTRFILGELEADGILVNPYMGDEVLGAFDAYQDRAVVVLARTSNPGASIVQDVRLNDGRTLWEYVLELIVDRWNVHGNLIPVISSTADLDLVSVRRKVPSDMPILLAGVGAQGGDYSDLQTLLNGDDIGVFVNSSRGLLYPPNPQDRPWQEAIRHSIIDFKATLNSHRR